MRLRHFVSLVSTRGLASLALGSLLLAGCGTEQPLLEARATEPLNQELKDSKGTLLYEMRLSGTRTVQFWEYEPGEVAVVETGHMEKDAKRLEQAENFEEYNTTDLGAIFLALQPGASEKDVPQVLRDATLRIAKEAPVRERAAEEEAKYDAPPLAEGGVHEEEVRSSMNLSAFNWDWDADKAWFRKKFCEPSGAQQSQCITKYWYGSYSGAKKQTKFFRAVGMAAGFNSSAYLYTKYKSCSFWPWEGCEWKVNYGRTLSPRHWGMVTFTSGARDRWAGIDQSSERVYLSTLWVTASSSPPPPSEPCYSHARAHATTCYNLNGTVSSISNSFCADACAGTYGKAANAAAQELSRQSCLGAYAGCCEYTVNQNFNKCGGG